jgi:hypothetical protein
MLDRLLAVCFALALNGLIFVLALLGVVLLIGGGR